jgi:terminase small subunit-like protein
MRIKASSKSRESKWRGRPTLCTPALTQKICEFLADANTISASCETQGIGVSTYHEWRNKYPDFSDATTRARAEARIKLVKEIKRCSCDDWRGWAWLAERMFPAEFGRSEQRTLIVERPPAPPRPIENVSEKRSTDWIDEEIPFSKSQLDYIAKLRRDHLAESPSGDDNGRNHLTLNRRA